MLSEEIIDFGSQETYPARQLAENWQSNDKNFYDAARSLNIPVFQLLEFLNSPAERSMNDMTAAALVMWYMSGVDIESDNGFATGNKLMQVGDMSKEEFDMTPEGKLFWEICAQDWVQCIGNGSETNPQMFQDEMDKHNPAHVIQNQGPPDMNIYYDPNAPSDENHSNVLGQLAAGEPWNEFLQLMWAMKDDWGPSIDWNDVVGGVMTTNKKEVEKKYREMSFDESTMLRTGEMVQHMIAEVGFSKETVAMRGHGLQFRASYDYITNPSISARDFRWEVERTSVAMKIVLFIQVLDFLITEAAVQPSSDAYGDLQNINAEKWMTFSKLPMSKPFNLMFADPISIVKWEIAMLGSMVDSANQDNNIGGTVALVNALSSARNSLQLNRGNRLPRYGWIDNLHSNELYSKFTDSNETALNNSGGEKQALLANRSSASEIIFRRQSRQDEGGRDTKERYVYRDLHTEWGIHRPEDPLGSGAGSHRGKSNILRTRIS